MRPLRKALSVPGHGVGVVWWPELDPLCATGEGLVHVIEAEPETFWIPRAGGPSGFTSRLAGALGHLPQPKLLHGVGAPFGGTASQSADHRQTLAGDVTAMQPAWISDHLSFDRFVPNVTGNAAQAVCTGFFLPPAQGPDGIAHATAHITERRTTTGVPVAFETPVSYLQPRPGEMPDGAFAAEVAEVADCGIVLNLHNLLCNERNGRQTVEDFCNTIPLERVWEIHVAGGHSERGFWLDAHSGLVEPALMQIVAGIVPRLPALGAIIFEIMPGCVASTGLTAISALLGQLNTIWATRGRAAGPLRHRPEFARVPAVADAVTPALWEYVLGAAVTGTAGPDLSPELADWVHSAEASLDLYRYLAQEGRASSLVATAPNTIRSLLIRLGEAQTRHLLARFWRHATPAYTLAEEARAFLDFLSGAGLAVPGLEANIASDQRLLDQLGLAAQ